MAILAVAACADDAAPVTRDDAARRELVCPTGAAPIVRVTIASTAPARDDSLPLERLSQLGEGAYGQRALGATVVHYGVAPQVTAIVAPSLTTGFCAYATQVTVALALTHRTIYVAREFRDEPCVHREVLAHELRHVRLDDALVADERDTLASTLPAALAAMPAAWGDSKAAAEHALIDDIRAILAPADAQFMLRRRLAHAERIDTVAEQRRTQVMCGGRVPQLLATMPSR